MSTAPQDRELLTTAATAQQAFARGTYQLAAEQYRRALSRARLQDDPALIGDQAYNFAVTLAAQGKIPEARERLTESQVAIRRAGLPLADTLLVEARLIYSQSIRSETEPSNAINPEVLAAAEQAAGRVLDDPASRPTKMHRMHVAVLFAEIACDRRDAAKAGEYIAQVQRLAPPASPVMLASPGPIRVTGKLQLLQGAPAEAARSFDEESRLQRQAGRYHDMSRALVRAGAAHVAAGQSGPAADRYYRAAASLFAQEKPAQAKVALDAAERSSMAAADRTLQILIESLKAEMLSPIGSANTRANPLAMESFSPIPITR